MADQRPNFEITAEDVALQREYLQRYGASIQKNLGPGPKGPDLVGRVVVTPNWMIVYYIDRGPLPFQHAVFARALQVARGETRESETWRDEARGRVLDLYIDDVRDDVVAPSRPE